MKYKLEVETDSSEVVKSIIDLVDESVEKDKPNEALRRAAEAHDRYTGRNGWIRHDGKGCPVHPMDIVDIRFEDYESVWSDRADQWDWRDPGIYYYCPLRDSDGIPYCSAEGLKPWAEYVATDEDGTVWQYEKMPIPDLDFGRWSIEGIEMRTARRAPEHFANTHDHWTQTLRRVWREN